MKWFIVSNQFRRSQFIIPIVNATTQQCNSQATLLNVKGWYSIFKDNAALILAMASLRLLMNKWFVGFAFCSTNYKRKLLLLLMQTWKIIKFHFVSFCMNIKYWFLYEPKVSKGTSHAASSSAAAAVAVNAVSSKQRAKKRSRIAAEICEMLLVSQLPLVTHKTAESRAKEKESHLHLTWNV